MDVLTFGGDRQLTVAIDPPAGLWSGAGVHRLTFAVSLDTRETMSGGVPLAFTGEIWLSLSGNDWLGTIHTERPVVTTVGTPFPATLVLTLTDEQLAVIERRRAGSDLEFNVHLWVTCGYDPALTGDDENTRWPTAQVQTRVSIQSEAWARLLRQVHAGVSLAVVLPIPIDQGDARSVKIGNHLRDAIRKVNMGEYADAVVAARRAVDLLDDEWPTAGQALAVKMRERSFNQRLGILREGLASVAGPAPHGDENASQIVWNRENALAVIAGVAALAACAS